MRPYRSRVRVSLALGAVNARLLHRLGSVRSVHGLEARPPLELNTLDDSVMSIELFRTEDLAREGSHGELRRRVQAGEVVRLTRGRYLSGAAWRALDVDARYRIRIRAFAETARTTQVFSHWSAAVLWGYPIVGDWPRQIHTTVGARSGQRSTDEVVRHVVNVTDEDVVEHEGLLVTTPLRTLCDLARLAPFVTGVAALDRAVAAPREGDATPSIHVPREALLERAASITGKRGVRRLRQAIDFADGRSGSAGETFSRVQIGRLRMPRPDLQVEVVDLEGRLWHSDFGWEEVRQLGEFDGLVKYTRNQFLRGRSVADVVIAEKLREDAMRAASGCGIVRWVYAVAANLPRFERLLRGAGLRPENSRLIVL